MGTTIRFLGVAGFEITSPAHRILIDPFLSQTPLAPVDPDELETPDVILVSHAAVDHLGDTARIARRTGAPVVCGGDVRELLIDAGVPSSNIRATVWGVVVEVGGVVVRPVECHHWSMGRRSDGQLVTGTPLAFIVEAEPGVRVYHYGDTSYFDMSFIGDLYRPNVGLIGFTQPHELAALDDQAGVELTGELSPDEAGRVAEMLGLVVAVGCHYLTPSEDGPAFETAVVQHDSTGRRRPVLPELGEVLTFQAEALADAVPS